MVRHAHSCIFQDCHGDGRYARYARGQHARRRSTLPHRPTEGVRESGRWLLYCGCSGGIPIGPRPGPVGSHLPKPTHVVTDVAGELPDGIGEGRENITRDPWELRRLLRALGANEARCILFAALAQFERRLIQERTRVGLAAARVRGNTGGASRSTRMNHGYGRPARWMRISGSPCWTSAARSVSCWPCLTGMWCWADARQTPRHTTEGSRLTAGSSWRMVSHHQEPLMWCGRYGRPHVKQWWGLN